MNIDASILDDKNRARITALKNPKAERIIEEFVNRCKPAKITVLTDSNEDIEYARKLSIQNGEEAPLAMKGHTVHFDNYFDQARDPPNTKLLLPKGKTISKSIRTEDRDEGLNEIFAIMDGIMRGKEMLVAFYTLGPQNSVFSIPALQLTDSAYVVHSENLLYRQGYQDFLRLKGSPDFFYFVHSAGELLPNKTCKNLDKRRVFIDLEEERVLTVNNQYAGNSVGLKKLALRLGISKASREDWLCEHMFVMGVHPPGKKRVTYFTGAFPSMCGKTSTAMISGQSIVGDDIAYLRIDKEGRCIAANVECGIFGIIQDINEKDDPVINKALTTQRECIFGNVLVVDGMPHWLGMGKEIPERGHNHAGEWHEGMTGPDGKKVNPSHKNARFTLRINDLDNADRHADDSAGVPVSGVIYGGRDSDTSVPVVQSLSWAQGVVMGAAIESETTAASIGSEGQMVHNPMANIEFLVIPLGVYVKNHLKFGEDCTEPPQIFTTNYFLKEDGKWLNGKLDKKVWILWMEGRVNGELSAIETPMGHVPIYDDLKRLFHDILGKEYSHEDYVKQFSIRVSMYLKKLDRIEAIYRSEDHVPPVFHRHIQYLRQRLVATQKKFGKDTIVPSEFE